MRIEVEKALERLQIVFQRFPEGASLETLQAQYGEPIGERTLRRHLVLLQQQGKVRASGATRSRTGRDSNYSAFMLQIQFVMGVAIGW